MTDGLRWQEVFSGAEEVLVSKEHGVDDVEKLRRTYWRETPEARREALMPFLWGTIASQGQVFGNQNRGSAARVTNGRNISYPGYSEILCGFADPRVTSNAKILNPNRTVLDWLADRPRYRDKVAAFGAWDAFPFIRPYPA